MLFYLAYGSNLHPLRLADRIASVVLIGSLRLDGYRLLFHKKGRDGSGKCDLRFTGSAADSAYGALYAISSTQKARLDRFEGRGRGYMEMDIEVTCRGSSYNCFTYRAQEEYISASLRPFDWYKELVLLGGEHLGFPEAYLESIRLQDSYRDPDGARDRNHRSLIGRMTAER